MSPSSLFLLPLQSLEEGSSDLHNPWWTQPVCSLDATQESSECRTCLVRLWEGSATWAGPHASAANGLSGGETRRREKKITGDDSRGSEKPKKSFFCGLLPPVSSDVGLVVWDDLHVPGNNTITQFPGSVCFSLLGTGTSSPPRPPQEPVLSRTCW